MGHIHLMLNHFPVSGIFFATALLGYGFYKRSDDVKLASLWAFILIALLALPVFFTGDPAEDMVKHMPGITEASIHKHENAATVALVFMELLGALSVAGAVFYRKNKTLHGGLSKGLLVLAIITAVLTARAANLGGVIRHSELRAGFKAGQDTDPDRVEAPEEDENEDGMPEPANK